MKRTRVLEFPVFNLRLLFYNIPDKGKIVCFAQCSECRDTIFRQLQNSYSVLDSATKVSSGANDSVIVL